MSKKASKARKPEKSAGHHASKKAKPKASKAKAHKHKEEPKKKVEAKAEAPKASAAAASAGKPLRKGITIVSPKPAKKPKAATASISMMPAGMGRLLDP